MIKINANFIANKAEMWKIVEAKSSNYPNSLFLFSNKELVKDAFSYLCEVDKKQTAKTLQGVLNSMKKEVFNENKLESTLAFVEDIFSNIRQIAAKAGSR